MKDRQRNLLAYHADLAAFASSKDQPVFVILDLEDPDGFEIASQFVDNAADRRDAIAASGEIPAYTLCLSITDANKLIDSGWPNLRKISSVPDGFVPVLLFSCTTCLSALLPK